MEKKTNKKRSKAAGMAAGVIMMIIGIAVVIFGITTLTGCGGPSLTGTYFLDVIEGVDGTDETSQFENPGENYIELRGDGTFEMVLSLAGEGSIEGDYEVEEKTLSISSGGDVMTMTIDGGTITVEEPFADVSRLIFKKK